MGYSYAEQPRQLITSVVGSPGRALEPSTREAMQRRFGYDFGGVRIHDDAQAAAAADQADADAYSIGSHIVFGEGCYARGGTDLLTHELAHVVQQHLPAGAASGADAEHEVTQGGPLSHQPVGVYRKPSTAAKVRVPVENFARRMQRLYNVGTVRVGTQSEQEGRLTPQGGAPPGGIHIPNWTAWTPSETEMELVENGISDVAQTFGELPLIREIVFFEAPFALGPQNTVIPDPRQPAASFGAGQMTVYHAVTTSYKGLPIARSNTAGKYPPLVAGLGGTGVSPGAPIPIPDQQESARRFISHELGHGMLEAALGGSNPATATDPTMLTDYERAVGWVGGQLFDIGQPTVAAAILAKTPPPAIHQITGGDWNHPKWIEQPVSRYMVEGGSDEDFSEAFMVYVQNPNLLLSRSPTRFRFIQGRHTRWSPNLVKPAPAPSDYPLPQGDTRIA